MEAYSVLMSVYKGANPSFFDIALESLVQQTIMPDDIVVVCDGPLTRELDAVLEKFCLEQPHLFNVIRLNENVGIGAAANIGLPCCKNDLVAKMDADDIAVPTRCEMQVKRFAQCRELVVLGGYIEEFDEDPLKPFAVREVPLENEKIREFARRRQPFNNMTVMYRRDAVMAVGGYRNLRRGEDFDLYIRLLREGYYCENLKDVLVRVRVDKRAFERRGSLDTLIGCVISHWRSYRFGCSSLLDFCICVCGEVVILLTPPCIRQFIYQRFLRKSV